MRGARLATEREFRQVFREELDRLHMDLVPVLRGPPALSQAERLEVLEVKVARAERYLEWAAYGALGFLVFVWLIAAVRR